MKKNFSIVVAALGLLSTISITSCLKTKISEPPNGINVTVDPPKGYKHITIAALKAKTAGTLLVPDSVYITGFVVANDKGGNFYKQIMLQDSTGGIPLLLEKNGLSGEYPVGRTVHVACKGLTLSPYGRFMQLGYAVDATNSLAGIPSALISTYVTKSKMDAEGAKPTVVTLAQISNPDNPIANKLLGKLLEIKDVEFQGSDILQPYAQSSTIASATNRMVEDCGGNSLTMRNSGFATFQPFLTPSGKGTLLAVYTRYNSTPQLMIRDTNDVQFNGPRCGSNATLLSVQALKDSFAAGKTTLVAEYKIKGIVISDKDNKNIQSQNLVLQDGAAGIVVRFQSGATYPYVVGDEIEVNITGGTLSEYQKTLQISANTGGTLKVGTGTVTPVVKTMAEVIANMDVLESTLVKISNVTFPVGTFGGSNPVTDGTDTMTLYTWNASTSATFQGNTMPTGAKTITAIVGQFGNTNQLSLRNLNDIQ
jgi:hypothetical protein